MKRKNNEAQSQAMVFQWLTMAYPHIRSVTFSIPNGGSRNALEGANLKRQGVTKGVLDIFMSVTRNGYHGLYIEMKYGQNKLTKEQADFKRRVENEGYCVKVCYSFEQAQNAVEEYLKYVK